MSFTPPDRASGRLPLLAVALTSLGAFLVSLDVSVANAVLPAIGRSFSSAQRQDLAWVITAYAIVFAAALVPGGRLADRAGRRRVFSWGLAVFAVGSAVCGIAVNLPMLLAGRLLQGAGAAAAQPASLGLLLAGIDSSRRALLTARWFGAGALGIGLGPLVGGVATDALNWRAAFLINVPLVVWALIFTPRALRETEPHPGRSLPDPLGALLLAAGAAALTLGITELSGWGAGDARTLGALVAAAGLGSAFVWRCHTTSDPVLQLEMLRSTHVAKVTLATLAYSAGFFGLLLTFVLFLTSVWGLSIVQAGLGITPMTLIVVVLSRRVGGLPARVGFGPPLAAGAALIAAALLLGALTAAGETFRILWLAQVTVAGVGIGLCYPLLGAAAVSGLRPADLAAATAINQCARQLGAALGVALCVAVLGSAVHVPAARFHLAWIVCAALCLLAAACSATIHRPTVLAPS
ncbi:MAG: MFS transporter [Actinomycetota bacterium]|nr:MFS transporter [Actinomycetota bacterium]